MVKIRLIDVCNDCIYLVAGRDGLMPHIFSMRHYQSNVPMIAIMFEIIISFIFLFFMSNIGKLIICVGMINWICKSNLQNEKSLVRLIILTGILLAAVGLIVLRYKHPNRERPIKIPLIIPIIFIIILVILIVASAITDLENIKTSLILLGTAVPAYVFGVMWKKKPKSFNRQYNSFALTLQKLFHVVHDEHTD
jgi:L-type amino acid transporter 5